MYHQLQKQQHSLIAGLRATNEALLKEQEAAAENLNAMHLNDAASSDTKVSPTPTISNKDIADPTAIVTSIVSSANPTLTSSTESKEHVTLSSSTNTTTEGPISRIRKKSGGGVVAALNRSDSTGSGSGRKFLAPSLSDPSARVDKDRSGLSVVSAANMSSASGVSKPKPRRQIGGGGGVTPVTSSSKTIGSHAVEMPNHHTASSHHLLSHHLLHHHHHGTNDRLASAASGQQGGSSGTCSSANHSSANATSGVGGTAGGIASSGYSQHHLATMDFHMAATLGSGVGFGGQFQAPTLNKTLSISNQVSLVYEVHDWWSEQVVGGVTISEEDE